MSEKAKDNKNRWRSKTVGFRMSPEEADLLDMMVNTSGLNKQEYLIKRVLQQEVKVYPNPRIQKYLKIYLENILEELVRLNNISPNNEIFDTVRYLAMIVNNMSEKTEQTEKSPYPAR